MTTSYDHILIVGFGAPEKKEDIVPFLKRVAEGREIPAERLAAVEKQYELIGGKSPYNQEVFRFVLKLKDKLAAQNMHLPVFTGMKNWNPFLSETLELVHESGYKKGLAIIFTPHRSVHSCSEYQQAVHSFLSEKKWKQLGYSFLTGWGSQPLFAVLQAELLSHWFRKNEEQAPTVLFVAHSIPESSLSLCQACNYAEEVQRSSREIAEEAGIPKWQVAFQSRSGRPGQKWLEPDILSVFEKLRKDGEKSVLVVPVGFFCDNAEILYDLDYSARIAAEKEQLKYFRLETLVHHPRFTALFSEAIRSKLNPATTPTDYWEKLSCPAAFSNPARSAVPR